MFKFTKDYYEILKVQPYSDPEEIKSSYRKLVKEYHPDVGGDLTVMAYINEAYSVLHNPILKQEYDLWYSKNYGSKRADKSTEETTHQNQRNQTEYTDYQSTPKEIIVNSLVPDIGYERVLVSESSLTINIQQYIFNRELYAYYKTVDRQLIRQFVKYDDFLNILRLYKADRIPCIIASPFIPSKGIDINYIDSSAITNNYREYIERRCDDYIVYVKKDGAKFIAIEKKEYIFLLENARIRKRQRNNNLKMAIMISCILCLLFATFYFTKKPKRNNHEDIFTSSNYSNTDTSDKIEDSIASYYDDSVKAPNDSSVNTPALNSENYTDKNKINESSIDDNSITKAEAEEEEDIKTPIEPPPHGTVRYQYTYEEPNFTIQTQNSTYTKYFYVKITDFYTDELVQAVFIHAGQTANIYVPYGTYNVKWVSGSEWYGYSDYFLNRTATIADDTFTFNETTGWEVYLYSVYDGNLETDTINIEDF